MKKFKKGLMTVALTGALAAAMVMPAFADETALTEGETKIQITKQLDIGQGIIVPDETFTFTYTAGTNNTQYKNLAEYVDPSKATYPTIADQTVAFSSADRAQNGTDATTGQAAASAESLVKNAPAIDAKSLTWPRAGLYVYEVKETAGGTTGMTYDSNTYYLKVYVKNGTRGPEVASVGVTDGTNKKDGKPTDEDSTNDNYATNTGNQFRFINKYTEEVTTHEDPDNPNNPPVDGAFVLKKTVNGDYADKTKSFKFNVTAKLPATAADDATVTIVARNAENATTTSNVTLSETATAIYLHDGESATITSLPAGTVLTVTETELGSSNYTPSLTGKHDVAADGKSKTLTGSAGQNEDLATGNVVVGSNGASVAYTNTFQDVTPTGIVINNFPYILMILVAIAGIAFYETKKRARA